MRQRSTSSLFGTSGQNVDRTLAADCLRAGLSFVWVKNVACPLLASLPEYLLIYTGTNVAPLSDHVVQMGLDQRNNPQQVRGSQYASRSGHRQSQADCDRPCRPLIEEDPLFTEHRWRNEQLPVDLPEHIEQANLAQRDERRGIRDHRPLECAGRDGRRQSRWLNELVSREWVLSIS